MSETILEVQHLGKSFGNNEILKDIDFSVKPKDVTCIIGPSGSGKSTLLRCMNLLETPSCGEIRYHGTNIMDKHVNVPEYRSKVGMVFQNFNLFNNMTVLKNCTVGQEKVLKKSKEEARKNAMMYLEKVGMAPYINAKPKQLSGGQKQRVAIARALATEPKVLLCDEATSALDPNTTAGVLSLLKDINTRLGITIVVITHEMSVIQEICDRVAIIDGGLIAEEGGVEEIFRAPKTKIGQELVMHEGTNREAYTGKLPYSYRLVFKGGSENEPVLGQMMIELKNVVNILAANTRTIENQAFGQMLVQFPEEKEIRQKMIQYLTDRGVEVEEVEYV